MSKLEQGELKLDFYTEVDIPNYELNSKMPMYPLDNPTREYVKPVFPDIMKVDKESEIDILIVGAGPVGLMLCIQLARFGMLGKFKILDDRSEVTNYSRAELFHARTVEILNQVGLFEKIQQSPFYEKADKLGYASFFKGEPKYNISLPLPTNCSINHQVGIYQSELEKVMVNHLVDKFNFNVQRNSEFIYLEHNEETKMVKSALFRDKLTGKVERVSCKYLVGTDGGRSQIRKQHGFEFQGYSYDGSLVLLDMDLDLERSIVPENLKVVNAFWQDKYSLVWVIPRHTTRFVMYYPGLEESKNLTQENCVDVVNEIIHPYFVKPKTILRFTKTNANERIVNQMYKGNVFLAGDSAHVHSPAGGMGANLGLHDAYNLAFKLYLIHSGNVNKDMVARSYHLERRDEAKRVLAYSGKILRTNMTPNTFMDMIENRVNASNAGFGSEDDRRSMSESIAMTEYIYPSNPLLKYDAEKKQVKAVIGKRFPHTTIFKSDKSTPTSIFSILTGANYFDIFIYHPTINTHYNRLISNLLANYLKLDQITAKLSDIGIPTKWSSITHTMPKIGDDEGIYIDEVNIEAGFVDLDFTLFKNFGLTDKDQGQLFVVRPDGHLALSKTLVFDGNVDVESYILEYFNQFIKI